MWKYINVSPAACSVRYRGHLLVRVKLRKKYGYKCRFTQQIPKICKFEA